MANVRLSSADVVAINSSEEIIGVVEQTVKYFPELMYIPASPIESTSYHTLVQTALPAVAFRSINAGRDTTKATLAAREVACKFLDASFDLDKAAATACEWGVEAAISIQRQAHIKAAFSAIASQTWYGTTADADGFSGVAALMPNTDSDMVVDSGGSTASTGSSLFALRTGLTDVQYAWGQNGKISDGEVVYAPIYMADGTKFWGYAQDISGYVGLQLTNYTAMGRICNLTEDAGDGLTDDLISSLLAEFKVGEAPDVMFCSRRSLKQLQQDRTATNATGAPAPFPTESFGVPIYATENIVDTETILTAAS